MQIKSLLIIACVDIPVSAGKLLIGFMQLDDDAACLVSFMTQLFSSYLGTI